ncbi:hypothetical protein [Nocardioides sp.]|uniref:hypothetical protein n=1 Tax=Nocardioides sp. TaxID=35761 RepID=UPI003561EDE1
MSSLRTSYDFTLPRGYVDGQGRLHRTGTMRLATARDELEPLRDPLVTGPDDPRLTILVLTRVIEKLGDLELITSHEIEGLFAVDLAFLQDFYGVINFGDQEEFDALVSAQRSTRLLGVEDERPTSAPSDPATADEGEAEEGDDARPSLRRAVEELPRRAQ